MTEYLKPSFSVPLGGKAYSDGWDRIFGKGTKPPKCAECQDTGMTLSEDPALSRACKCLDASR